MIPHHAFWRISVWIEVRWKMIWQGCAHARPSPWGACEAFEFEAKPNANLTNLWNYSIVFCLQYSSVSVQNVLFSHSLVSLYLTFILMPRCIKKKTNTNIYIKGFLSEIGTKLHDRWAGRGQLLISGSIVLEWHKDPVDGSVEQKKATCYNECHLAVRN